MTKQINITEEQRQMLISAMTDELDRLNAVKMSAYSPTQYADAVASIKIAESILYILGD